MSSIVGACSLIEKQHKRIKTYIRRDILKAKEKGLKIKAIVANVFEIQLKEKFDIILFDMLLHTFKKHQPVYLLKKFSGNLKARGIFRIVFPDDMKSSYFINLLNSLPRKWKLIDEIIIKDVPKIPNNSKDNDFTFKMIAVQLFS